MKNEILLVCDDSHAVIWEGSHVLNRAPYSRFETVKVSHLGAALAYNLLNETADGPGKWGDQVISVVENALQNGNAPSCIMLCFGEIDVRTQIVKRALTNSSSIEHEVAGVADRLIKFAHMLFEKFRIPVLLWEPVPSSNSFDSDYPAVGTEIERNYATYCFKTLLRAASDKALLSGNQIYSFGVFDRTTNFFETRTEFFEDGCHLNLNGLAVAIDELEALSKKHNVDFHKHFAATPNLLPAPRARNIASQVKLTVSSEEYGPSTLKKKAGAGFCFHTRKEPQPYVLIDIGYAVFIESLVLRNRVDAGFERAKSLSVSAGNDPGKLVKLYERNEVWGADGAPLVLDLAHRHLIARYILLRLNDEEYFHLGEVQIMARTFHR